MTVETAIVGLGVSGLGCALELTRRGREFVAFEREDRPGGLAKSTWTDGFRFDCGPHVLLGIPTELRQLFEDLKLDLLVCSGGSAIVALDGRRQRFVPTPFQRNLNRLSPRRRARLLLDLLGTRFRRHRPAQNYRDYAVDRCGRGIYDLFLGPYETKRLRYPLDQIPADWTARIAEPAARTLLLPAWMTKRARAAGSDARFLYPRSGGMEALPRAIVDAIPGAAIRCQHELLQIHSRIKRAVFNSGPDVAYENLVLSMPLPDIVSRLTDAPTSVHDAAGHLLFTSIYIVSVGFKGAIASSHAILRFPDATVPFYRLSFPGRYAPSSVPEGCDSVVGEFSHHAERHMCTPREARDQLSVGIDRLGLVERGRKVVAESVINIRCGHIVCDHRTRACVRHILDFLASVGIHTCGKYGRWEEMLLTHSMLSGIATAETIASRSAVGSRSSMDAVG